jgi:hypothetical protein
VTHRIYVSSKFEKSSQFGPTPNFNATQEWFETEKFARTCLVPSGSIPQTNLPVSPSFNATDEKWESEEFTQSGGFPNSDTVAKTNLFPSAIIPGTSLPPSPTLVETHAFTNSKDIFQATAVLAPTPTILPSKSFSQSKTFLRSPDFVATDVFISTITLAVAQGAAAGSIGLLETPTIFGIGAAVLAILVVIALAVWRLRRAREMEMVPEGDADEAMTEFTWEAQVDNAFTADGVTYQNPVETSLWAPGHFSRVLTADGEDDPFTQFE